MQLGIDFGTWYSNAVLHLDDGSLIPIKERQQRSSSIPSSIFLDSKGNFIIGYAADNFGLKNPNNYLREFKLTLGEDMPVPLGDRFIATEEMISIILKWFKVQADNVLNTLDYETSCKVVLTVPAIYNSHRRGLMITAAITAGFEENKIELLDEPVAAAIDYVRHSRVSEKETFLVYDLGGGTFDVAVVQKTRLNYQVLGESDGLENCGGIHFDRLIFNWVFKQAQENPCFSALLDRHNKTTLALRTRLNLLNECRRAKHMLSEVEEDIIDLDDPGTTENEKYQLSQNQFSQLIELKLKSTIDKCRKVIKSSGLQVEDIDRILLVGGSCLIPAVKMQLDKELNRKIVWASDLEMAISYGAALYNKPKKRELPAYKVDRDPLCS